jgi:hypothetical protein
MKFNKLVEYLVLFGLFLAVLGSGYIFVVSIIFKERTFAGFFNTWQFPMLLAIFIDSAYYKHVSRLI